MHSLRPASEVLTQNIGYFDDPTTIFNSLCQRRSSTLLLESAEIESKHNITSLLILDSALRIHIKNKRVTLTALSKNGQVLLTLLDQYTLEHFHLISKEEKKRLYQFTPPEKNFVFNEHERLSQASIFDLLRVVLRLVNIENCPDNALLLGGLFSYDLIRYFEDMPQQAVRSHCPDCCLYLAENIMVLNHQKQEGYLQSTLFCHDDAEKQRLYEKMSDYAKQLRSLSPLSCPSVGELTITSNLTDEAYYDVIYQAKKKLENNELFQIVPSRQYTIPCLNSLAAYEELKKSNPSPYMFYMQDDGFTLFGASPESALKYASNTRQVEMYPIAGTRQRGRDRISQINIDLDNCIELDLRTDQKEVAEHLMLVDLARNDFSKICSHGSRYVSEMMRVDRYSVVMHLVSKIMGKLKPNLDALHAYQACMNMGTLTGSPKIAAMQYIAQIEDQARGSYGGAIGYLNGRGDMDTCIVIRSAYVENQLATVQAGAGIVLHSDPLKEIAETANKAKAVLDAIGKAHQCVVVDNINLV